MTKPVSEFNSWRSSVKQVPRLFKLVEYNQGWNKGDVNLDIGGGRYDRGSAYLKKLGVDNLVFDPYARAEVLNNAAIKLVVENKGVDTVTLSNVLNVIENYNSRLGALSLAYNALKAHGTLYVTVYEKNGDGIGKVGSNGVFQANRELESYVAEIENAGFTVVSIKRKMITAVKFTDRKGMEKAKFNPDKLIVKS